MSFRYDLVIDLGQISGIPLARRKKGVYRKTFVAQLLPRRSCINVDTTCDVCQTFRQHPCHFLNIGIAFRILFASARSRSSSSSRVPRVGPGG